MRTKLSSSELSVMDDIATLTLSSPASSSSDGYSFVSRPVASVMSLSTRDELDSSDVFFSAPASPLLSPLLERLTTSATSKPRESVGTDSHHGDDLHQDSNSPHDHGPNLRLDPGRGEHFDSGRLNQQHQLPALLFQVGTHSTSDLSISIDSAGTDLSEKARQKRIRRLRREAEKTERQRIVRDYANHTPLDPEGSDDEVTDSTSDTSESTQMSYQDAASSVDAFFRSDAAYMADPTNKLVLWQSLCVELGLCQASDGLDPFPPRSRPGSPSGVSDASTATADSNDTDESDTTIPSLRTARPVTPRAYHPLPLSLTAAKRLLAAHAHVNLADFVAERSTTPQIPGQDYSHLLHPSAAALRKYTMRTGKFIKVKAAKREWLQPLLKDFGFKRGVKE